MKQISGQMNLFDFIEKPKEQENDLLPCDTCGHDVRGCCDYDYIANHDYCRLGDKWIPKTVTMFGQEWNPIEKKPEDINPEDDLEVLGTYKYDNKERWSCCHAYYDGNEIIAVDVPWDIPRPVWKYWRLKERVYPVEIMGICDDAFCPVCGDGIDELNWMDCEKCPSCGARISWEPWHRMNDEDNQELFGENWRDRFGKMVKKTKECEK